MDLSIQADRANLFDAADTGETRRILQARANARTKPIRLAIEAMTSIDPEEAISLIACLAERIKRSPCITGSDAESAVDSLKDAIGALEM